MSYLQLEIIAFTMCMKKMLPITYFCQGQTFCIAKKKVVSKAMEDGCDTLNIKAGTSSPYNLP